MLFHIDDRLVKIENSIGFFKEFQADIAWDCKQRQIFGNLQSLNT